MKILVILDHLKGGGAERMAAEFCKVLDKEHTLLIALLDGRDVVMPIDHLSIIDLQLYHLLQAGLWRNRKRYINDYTKKTIDDIYTQFKPDIILCSHCYAYQLLPILKGNKIAWVHGEILETKKRPASNLFRRYKAWRHYYLGHKYFKKTLDGGHLLVVNDDLKTLYSSLLPNARIDVLSNGIDIDKLKKYQNTPKIYDVVFVARLSREKQPAHALTAFAKSGLTGKMAVVGDGNLMPELVALAKQLAILERVDFLGWQQNPYPIMASAHCLVLSSSSEGFGLVIAEALAMGVPCVAYRTSGGVVGQLQSYPCALVAQDDIDALAHALRQVVQHPYAIDQQALQQFSINTMAKRFVDIVNDAYRF